MDRQIRTTKSRVEDAARLERYQQYRESRMSEFDARELSRYKNEPYPEKCMHCGAGPDEFRESSGMVGEDVVWCGKCHAMLWEDTVGAIRSVL